MLTQKFEVIHTYIHTYRVVHIVMPYCESGNLYTVIQGAKRVPQNLQPSLQETQILKLEIHIHTYIHSYINTYYIHTYIYTYIHIYTLRSGEINYFNFSYWNIFVYAWNIHTYLYIYIHTYIHTYLRSKLNEQCMYVCMYVGGWCSSWWLCSFFTTTIFCIETSSLWTSCSQREETFSS